MNLVELLQSHSQPEVTATGLCEDSRNVRPGDIFVAASANHEARAVHVDQAIAAGAVAVLVPD